MLYEYPKEVVVLVRMDLGVSLDLCPGSLSATCASTGEYSVKVGILVRISPKGRTGELLKRMCEA